MFVWGFFVIRLRLGILCRTITQVWRLSLHPINTVSVRSNASDVNSDHLNKVCLPNFSTTKLLFPFVIKYFLKQFLKLYKFLIKLSNYSFLISVCTHFYFIQWSRFYSEGYTSLSVFILMLKLSRFDQWEPLPWLSSFTFSIPDWNQSCGKWYLDTILSLMVSLLRGGHYS